LDKVPFEDLKATEHLSDEDVLRLLDYPAYFDLPGINLPENRSDILTRLVENDMIIPCEDGVWAITNLGAILFAKKIDDFRHIKRKAVRVIVYRNTGRLETIREQVGNKGHAMPPVLKS